MQRSRSAAGWPTPDDSAPVPRVPSRLAANGVQGSDPSGASASTATARSVLLGEALEVRVVVEDRGSVVLGDGGDEVVERRNAEMLVRGTQLVLQFGRAALGALGDPQPRQPARIDGRQVTTCSRFEQQRGARVDDPPLDPVSDLAAAARVQMRLLSRQNALASSSMGSLFTVAVWCGGCDGPPRGRALGLCAEPIDERLERVPRWARSCALSSRSFASAPRSTSSPSVGVCAPRRARSGSSAAASAGVSVIECRGWDVGTER